jgi:quercetin dioxygenase-like cupin family protein
MANEVEQEVAGAQHTSWAAVPAEAMNDLLTRQYVHGTQAMLARIVLKKGCIVPKHSHTNEQISYIAEGALRFLLGDEGSEVEKIVRAGEVLVIPGGVPLEDTVDFDVFAPPRQDWIDKDDSYMR